MPTRVLRPRAKLLPASALVPDGQPIHSDKAPTHRLRAEQPMHFEVPVQSRRPAGRLPKGAAVQLLACEGRWAHVVDERGLSVFTALSGLEPLP